MRSETRRPRPRLQPLHRRGWKSRGACEAQADSAGIGGNSRRHFRGCELTKQARTDCRDDCVGDCAGARIWFLGRFSPGSAEITWHFPKEESKLAGLGRDWETA